MIELSITEQRFQFLLDEAMMRAINLTAHKQQPEEQFLSVKEVASLLSISKRTVATYTQQGLLTAYRLPGLKRYKRSEVLRCWEAIDYGC